MGNENLRDYLLSLNYFDSPLSELSNSTTYFTLKFWYLRHVRMFLEHLRLQTLAIHNHISQIDLPTQKIIKYTVWHKFPFLWKNCFKLRIPIQKQSFPCAKTWTFWQTVQNYYTWRGVGSLLHYWSYIMQGVKERLLLENYFWEQGDKKAYPSPELKIETWVSKPSNKKKFSMAIQNCWATFTTHLCFMWHGHISILHRIQNRKSRVVYNSLPVETN